MKKIAVFCFALLICFSSARAQLVAIAVNPDSWSDYCTSFPLYDTYEDIFNVTLGTLNNSSDCSTLAPGIGSLKNAYSNYYFDVAPPDLARGAHPYFSLTTGTCSYGNPGGFKIFIDFNQDFNFTDPGENVYTTPVNKTCPFVETGFIDIPADALPGNTMMRVMYVAYNVAYAEPCGSYSYYYGETEDYRVNIVPEPACPQPFPLTVTDITPYTATLGWTSSATAWEYLYGPAGFVPADSGTATTSNPVTISGLMPVTNYEFYVRANCNDTFSDWSGPLSFKTLCAAYDLPLTESFNTPAYPECWKEITDNGQRWWVANNNMAGGTPWEMQAYWTYGGGTSRFVSPALNTSGGNTLNVSFRHIFRPDGYGTNYKIQSSSDGITWMDEAWGGQGGPGIIGPEPVSTTVTNNLGNVTYVAWVLYGSFYNFWNWSVDNISIRNTPFFIAAPLSLAFGYIPFGQSAPESSFDVAGYNLTGDTITIASPAGFSLSLNPGGPYTDSIILTCTPPLLPATKVYVNFTPDSDDTNFNSDIIVSGGSATQNVPVTGSSEHYYWYCTSQSAYDGQSDIFNVTLGTINNSSDCMSVAPGIGSINQRYGNYYFDLPPAELPKDAHLDFSILIGTCNYTYPGRLGIYIDFNHDGDFNDTNETAYASPAVTYVPHYETGTIYIPLDAQEGKTMMRVVYASSSTPESVVLQPCGIYSMGETEDYRVNIVPSPACMPPWALNASEISASGATLSWAGEAGGYEYQYGLAGFTPGSSWTAVSDTSVNISGLSPDTEYQFYVRADCAGDSSSRVGPHSFKTACAPVALPFAENFDGQVIPLCWSHTPSMLNNWSLSLTNLAGGSPNEIQMQMYPSEIGVPTRLISPPVNTAGVTCLRLSFRYMMQNSNAGAGYRIRSSADGVNWTDEVWGGTTVPYLTNIGPETVETIITHNLGNITYLAWEVSGNLMVLSAWWIDNVVADTGPVFQVNPSSLDLGYVPMGGSSSPQSFHLKGYNLGDGPVTVTAPTGFSVSVSPGGPWTTSLDIAYTPPLLADTMIYVKFTPQAASTLYLDNIVCAGGGGSKNFNVKGSSEIYYAFCPSIANNDWWGSDIFNVTIGTMSNSSYCGGGPGPGSIQGRYSNFYFHVPAPDLQKGTFQVFSVQAGGICYRDLGYNGIKIFIDFNQDGDFDDAGEEAFVSPSPSYNTHDETGTVFIPEDAQMGTTMMRVINMDTYTPSMITACGLYEYGETEDYKVNIIAGPPCPAPGLLTATSITSSSATLGWSSTGTLFNVEWGPEGFIPGSGTMVSGVTNPYTLSGLDASTSYSFYVQRDCDSAGLSNWTGPCSLTTLCGITSAPWAEGFEGTTFFPLCWSGSTGYYSWLKFPGCGGYGNSASSAKANFMNFYNGIAFDLVTQQFSTDGVHQPVLKFDYAYATFITEVDQLKIYYSTNAGLSFNLLDDMPGGLTGILNTGGATTSTFIPTASQWATRTLLLPPGTNKIEFLAISAYGNNLYIDNVRVEARLVPETLEVQGSLPDTLCYDATQTISVGGTAPYTVEPGGNATFIAGLNILYLPGTWIKNQGYMHGYISPDGIYCGDTVPPLAKSAGVPGDPPFISRKGAFRVFPNPTEDRFFIEPDPGYYGKSIRVMVYAMVGSLVLEKDLIGGPKMELSIGGHAPGIYLLRIRVDDQQETVKVLKR